MTKIIGITMGDAAGIGPEVIFKALSQASLSKQYRYVIIGKASVFLQSLAYCGFKGDVRIIKSFKDLPKKSKELLIYEEDGFPEFDFTMGKVDPGCGELAYQSILAAVREHQAGRIDAMVTAPICKESLHKAGHLFDGHTGLLAHLTKTTDYRMMFAAKKLKIIHVTAHMALREACNKITTKRVLDTIRLGSDHLKRLGQKTERIGVCGLNPHAGESGIFGDEDQKIIQPAVEQAQKEGINAIGPLPADAAFMRACRGDYDLMIAQYHDQGHIPGKLIAFDSGVNVTVGLPIIRTSVDHGTAFDIAGKSTANHGNLLYALRYAQKMIRNPKKSAANR